MDLPAITGALTAIKTATDIVQGVRTAENALNEAELKFRLADLMGSLAEAKIELSNLIEDVAKKDQKIETLEELLNNKDSIKKFGDAYYKTSTTNEPTEEPICTKCWEVAKLQVHLIGSPKRRDYMQCPNCKSDIRKSSIKGPTPSSRAGISTVPLVRG